ncbi:MAG TPA: hypothetical protein VIM16_02805 [Mucilaginibacter sp.]|jgi:hypothetical protein
MKIDIRKALSYLLVTLAIVGVVIIGFTIIIYIKYSHIHLYSDIDKDFFGIFGEFIGGVVGTLFSIVTVILVYLTYSSQQKDVFETKRLLQNQIDLSIKPDLYFTNSSFYGFSKMTSDGQGYALDFSSQRKGNDKSIYNVYDVYVDLVNIGVGVAKNIEFYWEFELTEMQSYLRANYSNNPLTIGSIEKNFVEFKIHGIKDSTYMGQPFYKTKRRFDILLSYKESSLKLQIPFPQPYLICYFMAIELSILNRLNNLNSYMALEDFPKCKLHLTYSDISEKIHKKTFEFLLTGHGSFLVEPKNDGLEMFGYDLYPREVNFPEVQVNE